VNPQGQATCRGQRQPEGGGRPGLAGTTSVAKGSGSVGVGWHHFRELKPKGYTWCYLPAKEQGGSPCAYLRSSRFRAANAFGLCGQCQAQREAGSGVMARQGCQGLGASSPAAYLWPLEHLLDGGRNLPGAGPRVERLENRCAHRLRCRRRLNLPRGRAEIAWAEVPCCQRTGRLTTP
jgi:hypothetical protein